MYLEVTHNRSLILAHFTNNEQKVADHMAKEKKQVLLRMDPKLHELLQIWAKDEFRSVNSHIEYVLRDAMKRAGRLPQSEDKKIGE